MYQELVEAYRRDRLEGLEFVIEADLWASEHHEHAPFISESLTWYLAPGEYGPETADGKLMRLNWIEKKVPLKSPEKSKLNRLRVGQELRR